MLAYERCATAMMQTTLIGGLGLAVFATSTFTPTQQFGYLMITMLGAALIGDLLLLPAILAGPLGKFFCARLEKDAVATSANGATPPASSDATPATAAHTTGPHIDISPPSAFSQPTAMTSGDEVTDSLRTRLRRLRRDTSHTSPRLP